MDQNRKLESLLGTGDSHTISRLSENGTGKEPNSVEIVLAYLLAGIDDGTIRPGDRIKTAELSSRLGLSRAPVREALHVLAGRGLVSLHPDRGATMRTIAPDELVELFEVASAIIGFGAASAARKEKSAAEVQALKDAHAAIVSAATTGSTIHFVLALNDFHAIANEIGGNRFSNEALRRLNIDYWVRFVVNELDIEATKPVYLDNYRRLLDAIVADDPLSAAAVVQHHVNWSLRMIADRRARHLPARDKRSRSSG